MRYGGVPTHRRNYRPLARGRFRRLLCGIGRIDLKRVSREELIERVLRLQHPSKTWRMSSKPPATDRRERREQSKPSRALWEVRMMAMTAAQMRKASNGSLSLKVTLNDTKPPIWRRLVIPGEMTLNDLHQAIQAAMDWDGEHLHAFDVAGRQYGDPDSLDEVADEERLTLNKVVDTGVSRFTYTYDFGDNWEHAVLIEQPRRPLAEGRSPACVAGKRKCPPENCGGPWGYQELLSVLADPTHPEYQERSKLVGKGFDPDEFAIEEANTRLAARFPSTL